MPRPFWRGFGLAAAFGALACSLIVDTEGIDAGCPASTKFCGGDCVSVDDPSYGCSNEGCDPCLTDMDGDPFGDRFVPECREGACVVGVCSFGYGCDDCSASLLSDPDNCGTCGHSCGRSSCSLGECVLPGAGGAGGADG